jgi:hypothetical protein
MTKIESTIPPRIALNYEQNVPKIIYQTFKSDELSAHMFNNARSFIDLNPEYRYEFYDDIRMVDYVNNYDCSGFDFTNIDLRKAFNSIAIPAGKADLWRYLILYETGGVYVDIDAECIKPLRSIINPKDDIVTCLSGWSHNFDNPKIIWKHLFPQWVLIHVKKSLVLKRMIETCVNAVNTRTPIPGSEDCINTLEKFTGACVSNYVYRKIFKFKNIQQELRLKPNTSRIRCEHETYQLSIVDLITTTYNIFGGAIIEKNCDNLHYHNELQKIGSSHWLYQKKIFND